MAPPVGVVYPALDTPPGAFARRAETLEYESIWVSEGWGDNAVAVLAEMASTTEIPRLGTAIVNVFSRTPALLTMSAMSLDRISDGRFRLGIGASHPSLIEGLHGVSFERQISRIEETIHLVTAYTGSEPVEYNGQIFDVERYRPQSVDVPIYNGALGVRNRLLTGRLCDGWIPNQIPVTQLDSYFEPVADGARQAGRDPDEISVTPGSRLR